MISTKFWITFSILTAVLAAGCSKDTAPTQPPTPVSSGWYTPTLIGQQVNALAVLGTHLFAGTPNGVFRSDDNGQTWTEDTTGMSTTNVSSLAVIGNDLYAGTVATGATDGGVYVSQDLGTSWTATNNVLGSVQSLGTFGSTLFAGGESGVFELTDGSTNWSAINSASLSTFGDAVQSFATSGGDIFGATQNGVFVSGDGGSSWVAANNGLVSSDIKCIGALGSNVFVGTGGQGGSGAIYATSDNGSSWYNANNGINLTSNGGSQENDVWCFNANGTNIYAGTSNGVYCSTNNGGSWETDSTSLKTTIFSLASNSSFVFAGTDTKGVWRSPIP